MRALALLIGVGVLVLATRAAAAQGLVLVAAGQSRGYVTATVDFEGLTPGELVVATKFRRLATGAFPPGNVRLRQTIRLTEPATGIVRIRARRALPAGRYYVEVSAVDLGGVTDCISHQVGCGEEWSNVRRVVVPGTGG